MNKLLFLFFLLRSSSSSFFSIFFSFLCSIFFFLVFQFTNLLVHLVNLVFEALQQLWALQLVGWCGEIVIDRECLWKCMHCLDVLKTMQLGILSDSSQRVKEHLVDGLMLAQLFIAALDTLIRCGWCKHLKVRYHHTDQESLE